MEQERHLRSSVLGESALLCPSTLWRTCELGKSHIFQRADSQYHEVPGSVVTVLRQAGVTTLTAHYGWQKCGLACLELLVHGRVVDLLQGLGYILSGTQTDGFLWNGFELASPGSLF